MTDRQGALGMLANGEARGAAMRRSHAFYDRYKGNALVLDKWFSAQALSTPRRYARRRSRRLARHPDFTPRQSQSAARADRRLRRQSARASTTPRARGYRFLADTILAVDKLNPQTAAKLVPPLGRWRRFDAARAALMRAELERIVATPGLSKDVFEQASKSLA